MHGKIENESLVQGVLNELPEKVENTLFNFCNGLLGKVPRSQDEFNPQPILSTMDHGFNIMVLDSKICLRTRLFEEDNAGSLKCGSFQQCSI